MEKVKELPGYVRAESNAILAADNTALLMYKKRKEKENKIFELENEINNLKIRIEKLESLLNNA